MANLKITILFGLMFSIILLVGNTAYSQNYDSIDIDWTNPATIDPLQPGITSFLDVKWQAYAQIGRQKLQQGNYTEAAGYLIAALRFNADDVISIYNLACCYSRLGYPDLAIHYIKKAKETGFSDYSYMLMDADFVNIRNHADFINCMNEFQKSAQNTGKVLYVQGSKLIPCRVHVPPDYDPDKEYPLLIGLHGYTGNAEGMSRLWRHFKKQNFIYVCPEAPYSIMNGVANFEGRYSWEPQNLNSALWKRANPLPIAYINNVRKYISSAFKVNKVFLFGFSQGAGYAYATGIKNADDYDGIICFAGRLPISDKPYALLSEEEIENGKNLPVFIAQGMNDEAISYETSIKTRDYLQEHGYNVTFKDFVAGHIIESSVLRKAEKWMLKIAAE